MSGDNDFVSKKWSIICQQLIALCAMDKLPGNGNEVFAKLLAEDLQLKDLNSRLFTSLCYYILGFLNAEKRDKLIRWPLTNLQSQAKFRRGVSVMINEFHEKYPWANIRKLPESYFMNPYNQQSKVVDFISKLTNLAIHKILNDSTLLTMHSGKRLNNKDIDIMRQVVAKATQTQEELIRKNFLSLKHFEDAKNNICSKCIALMQVNNDLQQQLNNLSAHAISEGISGGKKIDIKDLMRMKEEKLQELNSINEELSKYFKSSQHLLSQLKALKTPVSLSAKDLGFENPPSDLIQATSQVSQNLYQFFQYVNGKTSTQEEEEAFHQLLLKAKRYLAEEKKALELFLTSVNT